jgi:O-antigen/teichoic acid export membrane protein
MASNPRTPPLAVASFDAATQGELELVSSPAAEPPQPGYVSGPAGGLALTHNFAWTLAGNVILAACQWGVLIVIAKMGSPSMVGEFALALALTAPIMLLANQGLRALLATDSREQIKFPDYLGYRVATTSIGFLAICCFLKGRAHPALVLIVAASKSLDTISDIIYGLFQARDRMDRSATSMIAKGILSIILVAVLMTSGSIVLAAMGMTIASFAVLLAYDFPQAIRFLNHGGFPGARKAIKLLRPSLTRPSLRTLAVLGMPLGIASFLNSLSTNIPRYLLERYAGAAMLGIFAANVYLIAAGNTLITALAQSCVARLARLNANGEHKKFSTLLFKLLGIAALMGLAGVIVSALWGAPILRLIYKPEYAKYSQVFVMAMVTAGLGYIATFCGTALTAVRSIKIQPVILVGCVSIAYLLCILLIPKMGIIGAAWALVGTASFQVIANLSALTYARIRKASFAS